MYELLKKCKEAGFPLVCVGVLAPYQEIEGKKYLMLSRKQIEVFEGNGYIHPTLEEAIEACGSFRSLQQLPEEARSDGEYMSTSWAGICACGLTPLEAVLRLYLSINKNDTRETNT